jgi:hypothetical protein
MAAFRIIVAVAAVAVWFQWRRQQGAIETPLRVNVTEVVDGATWPATDTAAFLRELLQRRVPVIVRGAPRVPWTFEHIKSRVATARNVMSNSRPTFFYYDTRHALTRDGTCTSSLDYDVRDVPMDELVSRIERGDGRFSYYSTLLNETSPELLADFDPSPYQNVSGSDLLVNFWAASAGAVSRLHYDAAHNLFLQLRGRKRFLLVAPHDAVERGLPLYPSAHPCHRASPIDPTSFLASQAPKLGELRMRGALLEEGDLLYIPPFWLHHVETLTGSMSLVRELLSYLFVSLFLPSKEHVLAFVGVGKCGAHSRVAPSGESGLDSGGTAERTQLCNPGSVCFGSRSRARRSRICQRRADEALRTVEKRSVGQVSVRRLSCAARRALHRRAHCSDARGNLRALGNGFAPGVAVCKAAGGSARVGAA